MIKGHTLIDLKNIHTGEVEHWEDDNMVTNALSLFYKQGGMTNPTAFNASVIRTDALKYLLGGVLLLDTALTEQAAVVRAPAGAGMTGNGAMEILNSEAPTELGSWNAVESGWQQDGSFKMVWDWATSQGNGTINCVSLTSIFNGMLGLGNKSGTYKSNSISSTIYNNISEKATGSGIVVGYDNNKIYIMQSDFTNKTSIDIKVYKFPYTDIDIRDNVSSKLEQTITIQLPSIVQNLTGGTGWSATRAFIKNGVAKILIEQSLNYNNNKPSNVYVLTYTLSTGTLTAQNYDFSATLGNINMSGITDTHLILGLNAINLSDIADVHELSDVGRIYDASYSTYHTWLSAVDSSKLYSDKGIVDLVNYTYLPTNGNGLIDSTHFMDNNNLFALGNTAIYRDMRYIATINNLDSEVVKTPDKTMKVTYVLRFS